MLILKKLKFQSNVPSSQKTPSKTAAAVAKTPKTPSKKSAKGLKRGRKGTKKSADDEQPAAKKQRQQELEKSVQVTTFYIG